MTNDSDRGLGRNLDFAAVEIKMVLDFAVLEVKEVIVLCTDYLIQQEKTWTTKMKEEVK